MEPVLLLLQGLDCPNCSVKIEEKVRKLDGVKNANLNFISKKFKIELSDEKYRKSIIESSTKIILDLEPDVLIKEINDDETSEEKINIKFLLIRAIIALILFIASYFISDGTAILVVIFMSYAIIGYDVLLNAFKNILKGKAFDENFLMSIATVGAIAIGEHREGVAVMLFYQIGEIFQSAAVNHSRKSIADLMNIRPDFANVKKENEIVKMSPTQVKIGDIIIVKPGERIPLDGIITNGNSSVDTSALTGEAMPRDVSLGNEIMSGCINLSGVIEIQVSKEFSDSTVSKILELVENASSKKAVTERFITRFARLYTPIVVISALILATVPSMITQAADFSEWLNRALIFLVVSCPCALVISVPLSFFGGIGGASRSGILVKGANSLEALSKCEIIAFDKTGTLSKGVFSVIKIAPIIISDEALLEITAYAESSSNHPIAQSIVKAFEKNTNKKIDLSRVKGLTEIAGRGTSAIIDDKNILVGNSVLMQENKINLPLINEIGTIIYTAIDGEFAGYIVIADELKANVKATINALKVIGIKKTVMLTGDRKQVGEAVGKQIGIDEVFSELLPADKVDRIENLLKMVTKDKMVAFVGDGINDAPVLARADIGIAMGGLGSDSAIEAADIVLMTDELSKITTAIKISRKAMTIVKQNIIFAIGIKFLVLILGALGYASMWAAVFADVGVSLIAILNAMRALKQIK